MIKFENVNVTMQGKRILSDIRMKQLSELFMRRLQKSTTQHQKRYAEKCRYP